MKKTKDLTGQRFHRLLAERRAGNAKNGEPLYSCLCDCGNGTITRGQHLRSGSVKSCGCFKSEHSRANIIKISTTHGHCANGVSPTYESFVAMWARCTYDKHPAYHQYGGRGIAICERWSDFENFLADMGERPSKKHSLDRVNNNGNYEPGNCRWATWKEQARNRSSNRVLTFNGRSATMVEWAELAGIKYTTLRARLKLGWLVDRALTEAAHA